MIHHHPPPTRGCAMKFIRRSDLEPQTRIDIVRLAWQGQGIYGKMTQLARAYHISRTFLYQMTGAAYRQLEILFSDSKDLVQAPQPLLEPLMLLLRLEGTCSIPSLSSILTYFQYRPNSVGYLSECFQTYGRALPSTLSMTESTVVFYLSDEIFARHQPILVTIEAQSTAILKIQLASDRSAQTWQAHLTTSGSTASTASAWPRIVALASWPAIKRRAKMGDGCVIGSMSFKTSLTDASNWSAKPMLPLPKRPWPRPPSTTPKARPISTSVSSAMIRRTARVSTPWPATISSISCSICCARLYTCVRLSVGSVRLKASARN